MAIADDEWNNLVAHLQDVAETQGSELDANTFPELLRQEATLDAAFLRSIAPKGRERELRRLREQLQRHTEANTEIQKRIDEIDPPTPPRGRTRP